MDGDMHERAAAFYPVFIDLRGRGCLVVGAGSVAARKVQSLLDAGAKVTVVSPEACEQIISLHEAGRLRWEKRGFEEADLKGCYLVIGATDDPAVNRRVFEAAERAGMPANIVDVPELCNFIVPSVLSRGDFQIAVSSGGASPILAREVRRRIETAFGPQYGEIVRTLAGLRAGLKERVPQEESRRKFWEMMIDLEYFDTLSVDNAEREIRERAERCLSQLED